MDIIQQGIITLLRSAVTGQKLPLPEGFDLETADDLVQKQGLLPLIYQGAFQCGVDPKSEQMVRYQNQYFRCMMRSAQQMQKVQQIFKVFDENGIDYLPVKGCVLKELYPYPEMRSMGDADILIRMEQYDRIKPIMTELGFREEVWSSYDVHWNSKELLVELHYKLFADNAEDQMDLHRYFSDGWSKAKRCSAGRHTFTIEDQFLYIFSHMTKHFRFCGIGARQIVDLFVYRNVYPELDEAQIERVLGKLELLEFYRNIKKLLAVWFEGAPAEPVTDLIGGYIFSGGSFGSEKNTLLSREVIGSRNAAAGGSKLRAIRRALFPGLEYLQLSYNVLFKHPWLYPLFWVVRWVDILVNRRKNIRKKGKIILNMSDAQVKDHIKMLQAMGLEYHF